MDTIVVSTQHAEEATLEQIQKDIKEQVILPVVPAELLDAETKYFINPTGRFVIGGPQGDAGLTGRKIIVDTYGGYARHGGGAFSGKDPTRLTVPALTRLATWLKPGSLQDLRTSAKFNWLTLLVSLTQCRLV